MATARGCARGRVPRRSVASEGCARDLCQSMLAHLARVVRSVPEARRASAQRSWRYGTLCQESVPIDAGTGYGTPAARCAQDRPPRDIGDRGHGVDRVPASGPTAGARVWGAWPPQTRCAKDHWHNGVDGWHKPEARADAKRHRLHVPEICANRFWHNVATAEPLCQPRLAQRAARPLAQSPAVTARRYRSEPNGPRSP